MYHMAAIASRGWKEGEGKGRRGREREGGEEGREGVGPPDDPNTATPWLVA